MHRDIPTFNQLIANKIHQKNRHLHQLRLQNIRSSQNSRSFMSSSMNNRKNRKAQQLEQDKKTEIEKQNIMLLNRMKKIMNRQDPNNKPVLQNHKNHNRMSMELSKIQEQNKTIYDRIERQRSTINNKKFYEERQKQLNILKFIGKYSSHSIQSLNAQNQQNNRSSQASNKIPSHFLPARRKAYTSKPQHYLQNTQIQVHTNTKPRYEQIQFDEEIDGQDFNRIKQEINQKKKKQKSALQHLQQEQQKQQTKEQGIKLSIPVSAKDIILFKINKSFHSDIYQVKILRKHLNYEIRCSLIHSEAQPITLQLSEEEGNRLLQQTNYNYKAIIDSLQLINHSIVLGNNDPQQINDQFVDLVPQTTKKIINRLLNANSLGISDYNEDESYGPEAIPRKKPTNRNRLDSLEEQNQSQKYIDESNHQMNHLSNSNSIQQIKQYKLQPQEV